MAKVKGLKDEEGKPIQNVGPGYPAEVEGWRELPPAGVQVLQVETERKARDIIKIREEIKEKQKLELDAKEIANKMEQHNREYKEKLEMKRRLGKYKWKRQGPRQPEISKGKYWSLIYKIVYFCLMILYSLSYSDFVIRKNLVHVFFFFVFEKIIIFL